LNGGPDEPARDGGVFAFDPKYASEAMRKRAPSPWSRGSSPKGTGRIFAAQSSLYLRPRHAKMPPVSCRWKSARRCGSVVLVYGQVMLLKGGQYGQGSSEDCPA
jgi:hypothetical protein